jgi:hypothetical protein
MELRFAQENKPIIFDRKKAVARLSALGILAGLATGFWVFDTATSTNQLSDECFVSYREQVGVIPFHAMKACILR